MSFGQQRLWLLQQSLHVPSTYNQPVVYRLLGPVDDGLLRRSLQVIVERHDVMRTCLVEKNGNLMQRIGSMSEIAPPWETVDLKAVPVERREYLLEETITEAVRRPFDLELAPLWRVMWLEIDQEDHVLMLNFHHSIIDVWSLKILFREWELLYKVNAQEPCAGLPKLPIQYADHAKWQRDQLSGLIREREQAYWRAQLNALPPPLELPIQGVRPTRRSGCGAVHRFQLTDQLTALLLALAEHERVTVFRLMLGAFQVLLHRYTGQSDIIVGIPVANRRRSEIQSLLGFFLNTLPIRNQLHGELSFLEFLRNVDNTVASALAHQELPFEQIAEIAAQAQSGDTGHGLLHQTMFVMTTSLAPEWSINRLKIEPFPTHTGTSKAELSCTIYTRKAAWECEFEYATDLFSAEGAARMANHFKQLLHSIAANPDESIARLNLLTDDDRNRMLVTWNDTRSEYAKDHGVHQCFEAQVKLTPHATALIFENQSYNYEWVNRRANQVAHYLGTLGVKPNVAVGVCLERSAELVIAILGVLKAGAVYVPLDPSYPQGRIAYMIRDTTLNILVTGESVSKHLTSYGGMIVYINQHCPNIAMQPVTNPGLTISPDQLAYVIYTSGSTGDPKGVMIPHHALMNHMQWMLRQFGFNCEDRTLQKTPFSFDASVWEFFAPLLSGGCLILASPGAHRDPELLVRLMIENAVTIVQFVPTLLDMVITEPRWHECHSLRHVFSGGEPLSSSLVARFFTTSKATLHNVYGPTEATIDATFHTCSPNDVGGIIPIGRPIANTQVYILDINQQLVPIDVPGELHIGGDCLARGYWGKTDLTNEKFICNPFSPTANERLYRTGDLARFRPDGIIEYLNRMDQQVKLHGYRIELGEIESVLDRHPGIKQSVVALHADAFREQQLVAYITSRDDSSLTPALLRKSLLDVLPDYMIPTAYVFLEKLPLTANGKVDRKCLPMPRDDGQPEDLSSVAPRNDVEETLVRIWRDVLKRKQVGVTDNFFDLGGDSILGIQIISRAKKEGLTLNPSVIFKHPTIEQIAAISHATDPLHRRIEDVQGEVPLTPIQARFFEHESSAVHHFNQAFLFTAPVDLNLAILDRAFCSIIQHHESLRLGFKYAPSGWQQTYAPTEPVNVFQCVDLSMFPDDKQPHELKRIAAETAASFDLSKPPLVRAIWFHFGHEQPARLLIVIHHLVVDGISWRILMEDLEACYLQSDSIKQLPASTDSLKRWTETLWAYSKTPSLQNEREHWQKSLQQINQIPCDSLITGENIESSAVTYKLSLDAEATQQLLHSVPPVYNTQINDVLLTALARTFQLWTLAPRLTLDLEGHGREELLEPIDHSRTIGWFTSMFPVSLQLPTCQWAPGDALKSIKEQMRGIPKRGIGYGILRYMCKDPILSRQDHPQILFNYLGQFDQVIGNSLIFRFAKENIGSWQDQRRLRQHLIEINCLIIEGRLECWWTWSLHRHRAKTIQDLAAGFIAAIKDLIRHCTSPGAGAYTASDFPEAALSDDELNDILKQLS